MPGGPSATGGCAATPTPSNAGCATARTPSSRTFDRISACSTSWAISTETPSRRKAVGCPCSTPSSTCRGGEHPRRRWAGLSPAELASVVSALVFESRQADDGISPRLPNGIVRDARPDGAAGAASRSAEASTGSRARASPTSASSGPPPMGGGPSLDTVLRETDMQAGDFVRWTKQVIDLLGQVAVLHATLTATPRRQTARRPRVAARPGGRRPAPARCGGVLVGGLSASRTAGKLGGNPTYARGYPARMPPLVRPKSKRLRGPDRPGPLVGSRRRLPHPRARCHPLGRRPARLPGVLGLRGVRGRGLPGHRRPAADQRQPVGDHPHCCRPATTSRWSRWSWCSSWWGGCTSCLSGRSRSRCRCSACWATRS